MHTEDSRKERRMRLIDADALIKDLEYDAELDARALDDTDLSLGINRELIQFDKDCKQNAVNMLKKTPTVDAVPVIRCNDCKYYDTLARQCTYEADWFGIEPNGFCSRAERKEE